MDKSTGRGFHPQYSQHNRMNTVMRFSYYNQTKTLITFPLFMDIYVQRGALQWVLEENFK